MNVRRLSIGILLVLGCTASASAQTPADCDGNSPVDLFVPNVLTPNSDSKNDDFGVYSKHLLKLHVEIYNRWGAKVYSYDGVNGSWDGTLYGVVLGSGTYFYDIEYTSTCAPTQAVKAGGYLTLLRAD
jgi:gliding motility-associated-like protein